MRAPLKDQTVTAGMRAEQSLRGQLARATGQDYQPHPSDRTAIVRTAYSEPAQSVRWPAQLLGDREAVHAWIAARMPIYNVIAYGDEDDSDA